MDDPVSTMNSGFSGSGMNKRVILCFFFILMMSDADGKGENSVPFRMERNKTLITIQIEDMVIPDILFDTGFPFDGLMIYNTAYRDSIDWTDAREVLIGGGASGNPSLALRLDSTDICMGDIKIKDQSILMHQGGIDKGFPSNGVMGYSIFGHYAAEFDYDKNMMILHHFNEATMDSGWTPIPFHFKGIYVPWIDISVVIENGKPIPLSAYIDFAAGDPVLLLEKPDMKFRLPGKIVHSRLERRPGGGIHGKTGIISKLFIGPFELRNVAASFAPAEAGSMHPGADAVIGGGSLARFNLIFDYSKKILYLRPNTHFND
jgi:hypothetical protein